MNSRVNLENKSAVVLHHYNFRDSSLLVNFFLSGFGKVSAIAHGVKGKGVQGKNKSKPNDASLLQPFQELTLSLTGKQELLTLKSVEATSVQWKLSGKSLYCAYYINELLLRLLPTYSNCDAIFQLYHQVLNLLLQCAEQEKIIQDNSLQKGHSRQNSVLFEVPLRLFELKLLEFLGYGLNLHHEISSGAALEEHQLYYYVIDSGPCLQSNDGIRQLRVSGKTLIDLSHEQLSDRKTLQESKQLLKWALAEHLGNKPLKSREMFKQLYGKKVLAKE